ncbi:MAG: alpha/beta hydrolase [Alphaproteobacteria bacterium]|nr:alpha/beta hydrolase [Alphaproteobacteria bacterium]
MPVLTAGGHRLEYDWIGPAPEAAPTIVFLHEGLGSVSMWRDFPARVADATGCGALVYSRWGYGKSDPVELPRPVRYMHDEGLVTLPEVLGAAGVRDAILLGHSDGGSIALVHAGSGNAPLVRGVITLAAHVFNEEISVRSIAAAKIAYDTTDLADRLTRHHADVEGAFRGWNDVWLHPEFWHWNIEEYLPRITCPVLAIQGEDDEYGTTKQIEAIVAGAGGPVEGMMLPACGHSPHRDQPEATLAAVCDFVARTLGGEEAAQAELASEVQA